MRSSTSAFGAFGVVTIFVLCGAAACARGGDGDGPSSAGDAGGGGADSTTDGASGDAGALVSLPPVSTDATERLGIYDWGVDDTAFATSGAPDRLTWSSAKVSALGAHTIRVALTPADPYKVNPAGAFDLAAAASAPAYDAIFANPAFHTIIITAYTTDDENALWQDGYATDAANAERAAITALGTQLLSKYPGKTFVIANWEGDNAIASFSSNAAAWQGFTDWTNARADGVAAARVAVPSSASAIYSALEFNVLRASDGTACGAGAKCVVSDVAPNVRSDLYSYSSWQSLVPDPTKLATQLSTDLDAALALVQKSRPAVTKDRFFLGELGTAREDQSASFGECNAASRMVTAMNAATAWGARWAIDWQIIDNAPSANGPEALGFGLYKASGAPSLSAGLLQQMYAGKTAPTLAATQFCPMLNTGGVINGAPGTPIHVGSTVSLYGLFSENSGDSVSGYVVHIRIADKQTDVTKGSTYWFESYNQINSTLSGTNLTTGTNALVWATSPSGVDTNGQYINIVP